MLLLGMENAQKILRNIHLSVAMFKENFHEKATGYGRFIGTIDQPETWIFTNKEYSKSIYGNLTYREALKNVVQVVDSFSLVLVVPILILTNSPHSQKPIWWKRMILISCSHAIRKDSIYVIY